MYNTYTNMEHGILNENSIHNYSEDSLTHVYISTVAHSNSSVISSNVL